MFRYVKYFISIVVVVMLIGITSAQGDLDNDGIQDEVDPYTIISASTSLDAGNYIFQNLSIENNAILTLNSNPSLTGFKGVEIAAKNIVIDVTSSISADGMGSSAGPGTEPNNYAGAGYGGRGGDGYYYGQYHGGGTYGSAFQPTDLGSGHSGMPGGGAIHLDISDTLTLQGTISSDAALNGITYPPTPYPGASGGSIFVTAKNVEGSGSFTAEGGTGGYYYYGMMRGGGGGGRIAVYYNTSSFNGISSAKGGTGQGADGSDGTVVFIDTTKNIVYPGSSFRFQENDAPFSYGDIILNNSHTNVEGTFTLASTDILVDQGSVLNLNNPGVLTLTATTIHLDNNSTLILSGNETLISNSMLLTNNSILTHVPEGKIYLKIPTLRIDLTSSLSADGMGSSAGPGTEPDDYAGAGYGGRGGDGYNYGQYPGGGTYGSAFQPIELGSGHSGMPGGGAIHLDISDTLTLEGTISSNAPLNEGYYLPPSPYPGGSGGSIFVTAKKVEGSGSFTADGGRGSNPYYGLMRGGGGGGRIAVYYNTSSFNGISSAKGSTGWGADGSDGTVIISPLTSEAPLSLIPITQVTFTNATLSETIRVKSAKLDNAHVRGNMSGTLDIPDMKFITITTGSFADEGFSLGNWNATLEGITYKGNLEGMVFFSKSDNKTHLKGTTGGDIVGILDGELTESVPGSGRYDSYSTTWQINRVNTELISGKLTLNGTISQQDSVDYSSTGLNVIQTMVEGTTSGHYTGPLTTMLTQVQIANPESIYNGQGFSIISYSSSEGAGEGWTFDKQQRPGITELHGFFSAPLNGIIRGTLDETSPPLNLFLTLERMDLGIPPASDVKITMWGPSGVSPGQTVDYTVQYMNEGTKSSGKTKIILKIPPEAQFLSASNGGVYSKALDEITWTLSEIPAKSHGLLSTRVTIQWATWGPYEFVAFTPLSDITIPTDPSSTYHYTVTNETEFVKNATVTVTSSRGTETMFVDFSVENVSQPIEPVFNYTEDSGNIFFESQFTLGDPEKVSIRSRSSRIFIDIVGQLTGTEEQTRDQQRIEAMVTCLRDKDYITEEDSQELQKTNLAAWFVRSGGQFVDDYIVTGGDSVDQTTQGATNVVFSCGGYNGAGTLCNRIRLHDLEKCTEGTAECQLASRTAQQLVNECLGQDPDDTSGFVSSRVVAHDPNIKYGPQGHVLAGQTLDYRVEYENEGEGIAFGVYFIDTLDEDLDASSLTIGPVYSTVDGSQIAPQGFYNPGTRTVTWPTGEVGPHEGGYANISVKVRSDAPDDTEIINYGVVYFPSVPEETRTNAIVSVVGVNYPPYVPANQTPSNQAIGVINSTWLTWTGGDPDGDKLRYDVYFGNTTPLHLLEKDTFIPLIYPGNLTDATTYSWQIIARDPDGAETPGPVWTFTTKSAQPSVIALPGFSNPPTDPDGDGLYEDLNANNRKDFNDVVLMFNQMQWIAANEPVSAFDFNGNGRIDFNDIVKLFGEI